MAKREITSPVPWNRDTLTVDDLAIIDEQTRNWHTSLQVFDIPNRKLAVVKHVLLAEVAEALEEREREGTPAFSKRESQKETLDVVVPAHAFAMRRGVELDLHEIRRRMNGYGQSSQIYDRIAETAGNLPEAKSQLGKELEWLLTQTYSAMWHLPEIESPAEVLKPKMLDNKENYPERYFGKYDHKTGKLLEEDAQEAKYNHVVKCLRLIRNTMNRPNRLLMWTDHAPHAELILDFQHADSNYQTLENALKQLQKTAQAV